MYCGCLPTNLLSVRPIFDRYLTNPRPMRPIVEDLGFRPAGSAICHLLPMSSQRQRRMAVTHRHVR